MKKEKLKLSVFILIPVLFFLTSCAGEKEAENTASGHWEYREEKIQAGEPELPYQDFPAEYGRLCDYSAAENGDVYFLCQMEAPMDSPGTYTVYSVLPGVRETMRSFLSCRTGKSHMWRWWCRQRAKFCC